MIIAGELSLWIALLMAAWSVTASLAGAIEQRTELVRSGERALFATFGFMLLAAIGLWTALLTNDFSLRYVASYTANNLPRFYLITSLWAGAPGSLLLWVLLLTACASLAVISGRRVHRAIMPWVTATLVGLCLVFLLVLCFQANPFQRLDFAPPDGRGLNPVLQNPWMAVHPPLVYLGLVATTVPAAYAVGALLTRRFDAAWLGTVRRWTLLAWCVLTVGIVLGMRWAYEDEVWSGFWNWDPMQNATLVPWLVATAFLHSAIVQERHGLLRRANVVLVLVTFELAMAGAWLAHAGVVGSQHRFASSPSSWSFLALLVLSSVGAWALVRRRLPAAVVISTPSGALSRESALLAGQLLLLVLSFTTLWGTLLPLVAYALTRQVVTVGAPYFNLVNGALGLLLMALLAVAPLTAWRKTSTDKVWRLIRLPAVAGFVSAMLSWVVGIRSPFALGLYLLAGFAVGTCVQDLSLGVVARRTLAGEAVPLALLRLLSRERRRYGGYVAHIGVIIVLCVASGRLFEHEVTASVKTGDTVSAIDAYGHRWTFTSQGMSRFEVSNRSVVALSMLAFRDGRRAGLMSTERRQYFDGSGEPVFDPTTVPGILSTFSEDVYLVVADASDTDTANVRIGFKPLMRWLWIGGVLTLLGGLVCLAPDAREHRA